MLRHLHATCRMRGRTALRISNLDVMQRRLCSTAASTPPPPPPVADTANDEPAIQTHILTWTNGIEWLDICGSGEIHVDPNHTPTIEEGRRFTAAVRPVLLRAGVTPRTISRSARRNVLPVMITQWHPDDRIFAQDEPPSAQHHDSSDSGQTASDASPYKRTMQATCTGAVPKERTAPEVCVVLRYAPPSAATMQRMSHAKDLHRGLRSTLQQYERYSSNSAGTRKFTSSSKTQSSSSSPAPASSLVAMLRRMVQPRQVYQSVRSMPADSAPATALGTISHVTDRITVIVLPNRLITVHHSDIPFIQALRRDWDAWYRESSPIHLINAIVKQCSHSFLISARDDAGRMDKMEAALFRLDSKEWNQGFHELSRVNRRQSVNGRVLTPQKLAYDALCQVLRIPHDDPYLQDVRSSIRGARVACEDITKGTHSLMTLHFERAATELEELMRFLTLFSAVFIPLELICAIFGMNVDWVPWMNDPSGFVKTLCLMACATVCTVSWFRARRFVGAATSAARAQ